LVDYLRKYIAITKRLTPLLSISSNFFQQLNFFSEIVDEKEPTFREEEVKSLFEAKCLDLGIPALPI